MTVREAIDDYLLRSAVLSPKTRDWYEQKLRCFEQWCRREHLTELDALRSTHLYRFQEWMQALPVNQLDSHKPYATTLVSPYTVRGYVQVIRQWSKWTVEETYLSIDPFSRVQRPKEPETIIRPFSPDQVQALLDVTNAGSVQAIRDRTMLLVLLDTGMRVSEFVGLTLDHLHLQDEHPWLEIAWQTSKGKKAREVALGRMAAQALRRYIRVARHPANAKSRVVWIGRAGEPLTASGVEQAMKELAKLTTITGVRVSPHTLRHTYAVQFLKNGGDIYALSRTLGHSSVAVTERYVRSLQSRDVRQQRQDLPGIAESFLT